MLTQRLASVRQRIEAACRRCGRDPASVTLVAVTKGVAVETVREAVGLGVRDLGENRVQEARAKHAALDSVKIRWHLIGHLQRNKAKDAIRMFDVVHSVDSSALVEELDRRADKQIETFIQVNVSGETTKFGCAPDEAPALAQAVNACAHLRLKGLMTIAPFADDPEHARPHFRRLRELRDNLQSSLQLSMGMSHDFEVAIEEGADVIRVGTAIFGARHGK